MSPREIEERIKAVEERMFLINMIDRWSTKDANDYCACRDELKELKKMLGR